MRPTERPFPSLLAISLIVAPVFFLSLPGCQPKPEGPLMEALPAPDYDRQLPPGRLALRKITDPRQIPDFTSACTDTNNLRQAIANSLHYLAKPSSQAAFPYGQITHAHAMASLEAFMNLLDAGMTPRQTNAEIRKRFDVYTSIGWNGMGEVLFTGYYTPIFDASPTPIAKFRYPLYKPPADLVKTPDGTVLGRRTAEGQFTPLPTRQLIEQSNLYRGSELYWLADEFEVYIAHVQGSAKLRLSDGRLVTVGYAANNGKEYHSIAKELVKDGKIPAERLSLRAMIDYFKAHPDEVSKYTWRNPRFVFFAQEGDGPFGSINEPVTLMRTIATDKAIYPRACLAFISTPLPRQSAGGIVIKPYGGFVLDQDTGGAIRAPGRCDIYMGVGDQAGELAGRTQQPGRLYYLFLKPGLMSQSKPPTNAPAEHAPATPAQNTGN